MDYSKLSTDDLMALKKGDYSAVSTEGLKLLQSSNAKETQPKRQDIPIEDMKISDFTQNADLTPSGLLRTATNIAKSFDYSRKNNKDILNAYLDLKAQTDATPKNIVQKGLDVASTFALPQAKIAQAGKFAPFLNNLATGAYQGGIIGAVQGLQNNKGLEGAGTGASIGATLTAGLPPVVKGAVQVAKLLPQTGNLLAKSIGRIQPETLKRAVQPDSVALDLTKDEAQNLLMNTTERIKNNYDAVLNKYGSIVGQEAKKLPKNIGVKASDLKNSLDEIYNSYSTSGNKKLNVAYNEAGKQYDNLLREIKGAQGNTYKAPTAEEIKKQFGIVEGYDKMPEPEFLKGKQDEAIQILSAATGKDPVWLKMNLLGDLSTADLAKRRELINKLVDESGDNLRNWYSGQQFEHYNLNNIDELGAGEELARKALDDIYNKNFYTKDLDDLGKAFYEQDINYKKALNDLIEQSKQGLTQEGIETFTAKANKGLEKLPQDVRDALSANTWDDLSKLEDLTNNQKVYEKFSISAPELHDIIKNVGANVQWGNPNAKLQNEILDRVYGAYSDELGKLSPSLRAANADYSRLMDFKKNEGIRRILGNYGLDNASSALRNYNSTVTKGNTNRNIQDLENLLVQEGYEPFLNNIDDVNAAMDLLNARSTGDSWLANIATQLTRPVLKAARGLNRQQIPQKVNNFVDQIGGLERYITPGLYGAPAMMLQGGVEYNEY
jgi:hypothetical protein